MYYRIYKTIKEYQLKEVHSFVILNMFHKCKYCDYQSAYRPNLRRHEKNKHGFQEPNSYQLASNPHPYEHPYLNNASQQPYPQRTPEMVANNTYYAKGTRAPTVMSV